ncbi:MAG: tetratricopeptide repeat protein [Alphaproteobacteria bacterium]
MQKKRQTVADAAKLLQEGYSAEAEAVCQEILAQQPNNAGAHFTLGRIAQRRQRLHEALSAASRAVAIEPVNAGFHCLLGECHAALKQLDEAEAHYREAILLDPGQVQAYTQLASLLRGRGDDAGAEKIYRQLVAARSDAASGWIGLGNLARRRGNAQQAEENYRRAIAAEPDQAPGYNAFGVFEYERRNYAQAIEHYRKALSLAPHFVEARVNLGQALLQAHRLDEAIEELNAAIKARPDHVKARAALAAGLADADRKHEAVDTYRALLEHTPDYLPALINLANLLKDGGRPDEAIALYRRALEKQPNFPPTYNNLGVALKDQGRVEEALPLFRRAYELDAKFVEAAGNYVMALNYSIDLPPRKIAEEHVRWFERFAKPLVPKVLVHGNDRDSERRIRVGFVSPDFHAHSVAYFIEPLFAAHDRERTEMIAFAAQGRDDEITERLRRGADRWFDINRLSDDDAAALIRRERIDILVDLAGHTARNRLRLFARKPAPVQMTWLGYPATTGMKVIDYRITDAWADPPGLTESLHSEKLLRLQDGFLCYQAPPKAPAVAAAPAARNGYVTFGSFNNLAKTSPTLIALWARILEAVPRSKLVMKAPPLADQGPRDYFAGLFKRHGVDLARIDMRGRTPTTEEHLAVYGDIDVALDSFPYNGTTTTCEALYMGVPVVALAGAAHVSRVSYALLAALKHDELLERLIGASTDEYVAKAVALAGNDAYRAQLRSSLRRLMQDSPLMDADWFARRFEAGVREAWRRWCRGEAAP